MKILFVMFSFTVGGAERLVADLGNRLASQGVEVHLCVINRHYDQEMLDALSPDIRVTLMDRQAGADSLLPCMRRLASYVSEQHISLVHCQEIDGVIACALIKALCRQVPVIMTLHAVGLFQAAPAWKRYLVKKLSTIIICISNAVQAELISCGIRKEHLTLIYNGIDMQRFPFRARTPMPLQKTSPIRIGCVARLDIDTKGQDLLVYAVESLLATYPEMTLSFAGDVYPPQHDRYEALKTYLSDHHLEGHIRFLGNVTDIPAYLAKLDIFVLPSRTEGLGISLIEAMATGLTCIASDTGGPAEILNDSSLGLTFRTGDAKDLADIIKKTIIEYPHFHPDIISQSVRARFDLGTMVASYLTLYRSLCLSQ